MSEMSQSPSWEEIVEIAMKRRLATVFVALPGKILSYDSDTRTASVQALIQQAHVGEDGARVVETLPVMNDVPLLFVGTADHSLTWPVKEGDLVEVQFQSSALGRWKRQGGGLTDPESDRHHSVTDAVAVMGLQAPSAAMSAPTDCVALETDVDIRFGDRGADDPVARRSDLVDFNAALNSAITALGGPSSIGAAPLVALQTALATIGSPPAPPVRSDGSDVASVTHAGQPWPVCNARVKVSDDAP